MSPSASPVRPFFLLTVSLWLISSFLPVRAQTYPGLDPARISEIATCLPPRPAGLGAPITDRSYWGDPVTVARCGGTARRAAGLLDQTLPPWNDDAYLEYTRKGQRPGGEKMIRDRHGWLVPLVLAECLEDHGRYLGKLNEVLEAYANEPTWTLPAHDPRLGSFHRTDYDVDLGSSTFSHSLSEALYLLGDKIDPKVRADVDRALQERIYAPFEAAITGKSPKKCWWLKAQMNWNAVCLAGVVGAAEANIPDPATRAVFAAAGEMYSKNYSHSFSADGYDTEGVGYWGYGLGHYIILRSVLLNATGGKIDLFNDPKAAMMALFGIRCRIGEHAVAPFADCRFGTTPDAGIIAYSNDALQLGLDMPHYLDEKPGGDLPDYFIRADPVAKAPGREPVTVDPLRSYFADVGILDCRPPRNTDCHMGIGIKAAGNGAHSHNDIGSYEIAIGDDEPTGDPGGPKAYDSKTFGPERYHFKLLNSYGHPVPVVNGQLQIEAAHAHPKVLSYTAQGDVDSIAIDMTSAYAVPELTRLVRTMTFSRAGAGQVEITDQFDCSKPIPLEDALITHGKWEQLSPTSFLLSIGKAKLKAEVETPGGFTVKTEVISELGADPFTRIGLQLNSPAASTGVRFRFTPQ
jgi:hypothetical protein